VGEIHLDAGWRFHRGDLPGAEEARSPDKNWETVSLPHDWAIAGPFSADNPSKGQGAFAPMGVGWYRKHFSAPQTGCARTAVQFGGVMANSDVWINGHLLGHRPSGYATFRYDLTPYLDKARGADNVLAVRADNAQQPSSRFYQGAGIYRHVHLLQSGALHTSDWSTAVMSTAVTAASADVKVRTEVRNDAAGLRSVAVAVELRDPAGRVVAQQRTSAQQVPAGEARPFEITLHVTRPRLWDISDPALYKATVKLLDGGSEVGQDAAMFGIRDAHFEPATGFWLNGRNLKIKGVALHSDIGALGMAAPLSLWEHRLRAMQSMGANAVRTAHNEVSPEFLDLCDRLGMLVLDEYFDMWTVAKNPYDYHLYFKDWYLRDTHDGVLRDRNHPSIIAWSAGNEIHDTPHPDIAKPILAALVAEYHRDDPSRPVTQALFRPNVSHDYDNGLADLLDVVGQNYRPNEILAAHEQKPTRSILGTENIHDRETWLAVRDHAPYSGMFIWSGTDYLGESRRWPLIGDASGLFDRTDFPKPDALEHEAWWASHPVLHIVRRVAAVPKAPTDPGYEQEQYRPRPVVFADWTPENHSAHTERVEAYSNCAQVTLSLNGTDLGTLPLPADAAPRVWQVPFAAGVLEAHCGDTSGTGAVLKTAGEPAAVVLTVENDALGTGFDQVAFVRATVVDAHGTPVPSAAVPLEFSVRGPGVILATDNADNAYTGIFASPRRDTLNGRAIVLLRATTAGGSVHLEAVSPGLRTGSLDLRAH
jgi:beta-galactosidase